MNGDLALGIIVFLVIATGALILLYQTLLLFVPVIGAGPG